MWVRRLHHGAGRAVNSQREAGLVVWSVSVTTSALQESECASPSWGLRLPRDRQALHDAAEHLFPTRRRLLSSAVTVPFHAARLITDLSGSTGGSVFLHPRLPRPFCLFPRFFWFFLPFLAVSPPGVIGGVCSAHVCAPSGASFSSKTFLPFISNFLHHSDAF